MDHIGGHVMHEAECEVEGWNDIVSWRTLLSADRTPSEAITLGTAEIAAGASVVGARHRHAPAEVYYVTAGEGMVHIDGKERPVTAGTAVFVPGGAWHFVRNTGSATLRLLYVFAVDSFTDVHYEYPADETVPNSP
jgi:quercetin dioxygenase-like cupin family protein